MRKKNRLILATLLLFCFRPAFSQTADSLSIIPVAFVSSTNIHFEIMQPDSITLGVYDKSGLNVKTFFQSTILPSGSYNINFFSDTLKDGLYFVKLDIGSKKTLAKIAIKSKTASSFASNKFVHNTVIFPNPTPDKITIPVSGYKKIIITEQNGKIAKSIITDQQIISLLDIAAGQYFITVLNDQDELITVQKVEKTE